MFKIFYFFFIFFYFFGILNPKHRASTLSQIFRCTTKNHFIYFNLSFHNTPNINSSIFLATSFKYYYFYSSLSLSLSSSSSLSSQIQSLCHHHTNQPYTSLASHHPPQPNHKTQICHHPPPQNPRNPPPRSKKLTPKINHHHSQNLPNPWRWRDRENRNEK